MQENMSLKEKKSNTSSHKFWIVKVRSFQEQSYTILFSLKTMTIFNHTSADFVLMSADVLLKMVVVLSDMRIA